MTVPTLLQLTFHPADKVSVEFVVITWSISIHLLQSDSTEIDMMDINKVVTDSIKDIIIDAINRISNIKRSNNKTFFSLYYYQFNKLTNYEREFINNVLNYTTWSVII